MFYTETKNILRIFFNMTIFINIFSKKICFFTSYFKVKIFFNQIPFIHMKNLYAFVIIALAIFQTTLQAQKTTDFAPSLAMTVSNTQQPIAEISKNFKDYSLFKLNPRTFYASLQSGSGTISLSLEGKLVTVSYVSNTVVGDDYKVYAADDNGQHLVKSTIKTYEGRLLEDPSATVAITADENFFSMTVQKGDTYYYIEPADMMAKQAKGLYILYKNKDYIGTAKFACTMEDAKHAEQEVVASARGAGACLRVEWGIAADFSMYTKYMNSIPNVEARTVSIYNLAQVNYKNVFNNDFEFKIIKQVVATTTGAINVSASTDIQVVLTSFNTWVDAGNLNFNNGKPDLASFWSDRDYDGSAVGLAYIAATCGTARTQVIQDFSTNSDQLRNTVAHETGHNFTMDHDASGSPFIMAPVVSTATGWSTASISALNTYVASVLSGGSNCLSSCSVPGQPPVANFFTTTSAVCAGGKVTFIDDSTNDPTSWGWTFAGGTPAVSALEDVTVTYNTVGVYDVTHTATNANGPNSITKKNVVRVDNVTNTYCNFPSTATSAAGLKQFKIGNFTSNSGSSAQDGNKYIDRSCSQIATLAPNTTYEITLDIGDAAANVTEGFKIWIDYNNNGVLNDASELVSFSQSFFAGTVTSTSGGVNGTTSTLKIKTPVAPVFDKFLRCRILTSIISVQSIPCYANLANIGQVEDFSIIFPSPFGSVETTKNVSCFGGNDGEINLNVTGGTAPIAYTWGTSTVTGGNPKNLIAGTYNVTVSEAGGSTLTKTITLTQPTTAISVTAATTSASCGQTNGTITATPTGGNGGYKYTWLPTAKDTSFLDGLAGGNYSLTLSDSKGCSKIITNTVGTVAAVTVAFTGNTTVCKNISTKITASGGATYLWSTAATTPDITVAPAVTTTYYVTVSAGGCSKKDSVKVTVAATTATINAPKSAVCEGESVTLTAVGGGTYAWSNTIKMADNAVTPIKTTTYTVTVSNNGCTATASKDITVNTVVGTLTSDKDKPCAGDPVVLTATGGGTYLWDNNKTSDKITVTVAGTNTFACSVTNTIGCTKKFSITVVGVPPLPKPIISVLGVPAFCEGQSAILSATAAPTGSKYIWSNSTVTISNISVTKAGNYTVKIQNGLCESALSDTTKITVYPPPPVPTLKQGPAASIVSSATTGTLWFFTANGSNPVAIAGTKDLATYTPKNAGFYIVQYTDPVTSCASKSASFKWPFVSVEDLLSDNQFKVYPNPIEENLSIVLTDVTNASNLNITNILGQSVFKQNIATQTTSWNLDITSWAKGTYFVNILNSKGEVIGARKVVKM